MMAQIEFEQKYLLDTTIIDVLSYRELGTVTTSQIRQCYDDTGLRYRETERWIDGKLYMEWVQEKKKSIKIGTPYSIHVEEPSPITLESFEEQWEKSSRRVWKTRNEMQLSGSRHMVVDFFARPNQPIYATIVEVEVILDPTTTVLNLDFSLPTYMHDYILKVIDSSKEEDKRFSSINMIDTPENIAEIERIVGQLYDEKRMGNSRS